MKHYLSILFPKTASNEVRGWKLPVVVFMVAGCHQYSAQLHPPVFGGWRRRQHRRDGFVRIGCRWHHFRFRLMGQRPTGLCHHSAAGRFPLSLPDSIHVPAAGCGNTVKDAGGENASGQLCAYPAGCHRKLSLSCPQLLSCWLSCCGVPIVIKKIDQKQAGICRKYCIVLLWSTVFLNSLSGFPGAGWYCWHCSFLLSSWSLFCLPNPHRLLRPAGVPVRLILHFSIPASDLYQMAEAYGQQGRQAYIRARFTFDLVWPIAYGLFLTTAISWLLSKALPDGSRWHLLNIAPVLGMLFDYLENIGASTGDGPLPAEDYCDRRADTGFLSVEMAVCFR